MHYVKVKGILSSKNGMNLYRGCQHGCIYCDARSHCYHIDHEFTDIEVKENALILLEEALRRKRQLCMIGMGAMTDPYMPLEEELCHTRQALQLIARYGFGATLLTKSDRVLRDLDLFRQINAQAKCVVQMTLTTADEALCRKLEPNVCTTSRRVAALETLRDAGIPTVVWLCPILPFINDTTENINAILDACIRAKVRGILCFGMGLTLREGNREYFYAQLDKQFPGMKEQYIRRYGNAYEIDSPDNAALMQLFRRRCHAAGILCEPHEVFAYLSRFETPGQTQLSFFD